MEMFELRLSAKGRNTPRSLPHVQAKMRVRECHVLYTGMRADRRRPQVVSKGSDTKEFEIVNGMAQAILR